MKKEKKSKISLSEFKAWLQGVQDMQLSDWVPNVDQWRLIREKIFQILPDEPITQVQNTVVHNNANPPKPPEQTKAVRVPASSLPVRPVMLGPSMLDQAKTPDIDTSNTPYVTPFT